MSDDNIINLPQRVVANVGGVVDESSATLCIYGETLEPDELTELLGAIPTRALKRGFQKGPRSNPSKHGAWLLEVRGEAPKEPQDHIQELIMRLPNEPNLWRHINEKYRTRISVGVHMCNWNRGFSIRPELLGTVASMGLVLDFDIYSYGDEEDT